MVNVWGVKCNTAFPEKAMRTGALCWISDINRGWGSERVKLFARARDGRLIATWRPSKRLHNYRVAWVPEYMRRDVWTWDSKEAALEWAEMMNGQETLP